MQASFEVPEASPLALLTNPSNNLLRLLSSPEFLNLPAPTIHVPNTNPTQPHALAPATFAGELFEVFDELGLGFDSDARGGGLKPTRQAPLFISTRIIHPLVAGIKAELPSFIEALEVPALMCTPKVDIFKDGQHAASSHHRSPRYHTSTCACPHTALSYYVYPVSSCLVGDFCVLARTRGPCSQDAFTPDAAIFAKSYTYWRKRKEGAVLWAPHHARPHRRDFISSSHHLVLPPLHFRKPSCHLSSVTPELYAICFLTNPTRCR